MNEVICHQPGAEPMYPGEVVPNPAKKPVAPLPNPAPQPSERPKEPADA